MDLSIVIVNYNVKDYLADCLNSIKQSVHNLSIEIIVVDNNSVDGSKDFLTPLFPEVKFIWLEENLGFSKANNLAIRQATGKYTLILNPDTLVAEDTLLKMFQYMEDNKEVGIAGCRVLNPDGSFQLACRRGFPSTWNSFCKLFGLQKIFPNSKLFSKYNLTYLSENETYEVDGVSGSFMFCDSKLLKNIGGFDEQYFMYGEDLDLCKMMQLKGKKVMYVHHCSIIHYKGESTKRSDLVKATQMYKAAEQFVSKFYSHSTLLILFLRLGIFIIKRAARIYKNILPITLIATDIFAINFSLLLGTYIVFDRMFAFPNYAYPIVFIVISTIFLGLQFLNGEYFEKKISLPKNALSLTLTFFILSSLIYFIPEYRFSRGTLIVTILLTAIITFLTRFIIILYEKTIGDKSDRNIIIAGYDSQIDKMVDTIHKSDSKNIHILGVVYTKKVQVENYKTSLPLLGTFENITKIANKNKADEVIITDTNISNKDIMNLMVTSDSKIKYHIIPEYDDIISARIIHNINDQFEYKSLSIRYKFIKRFVDIIAGIINLSILIPIKLLHKNRFVAIKSWFDIFIGKKTIIGIYKTSTNIDQKEGVISLASINNIKTLSEDTINNLNHYYQKNYSLSLDFDILLRHIIRNR